MRGRLPMDRARLAALWAEGVPTGTIAERLGVTAPSVCRAVREMGLPARPSGRRPIDREVMAPLWDAGLTLEEIAEKLGVGPMSVSRAAKRYGFSARPGGRKPVSVPGSEAGQTLARSAPPSSAPPRLRKGGATAGRDTALEAAIAAAKGYRDLARIAERFGVSSQRVLSLWHRRRA